MEPPEQAKESPDSMGVETGPDGIEALPTRVERYAKAKSGALNIAEYMGGQRKDLDHLAERILTCGDWLAFRHYFTVDKVRLHGASFCKLHLLCQLCAIRRGAKALGAYVQRWEAIRLEKPSLRPFLVTLTVKDGPDLAERFQHLYRAQQALWRRRQHGSRESSLLGIEGAVWSYEIKRGSGSGDWHPHLHMIALAEEQPDQAKLSAEWLAITVDSFIVDVRPIVGDPVEGFMEVFKYAVKFSNQPPEDTVHAFDMLRGKRLVASAGVFRGVVVPQALTDEPLHDLPFVEYFYRYLKGAYGMTKRTERAAEPQSPVSKFARIMTSRGSGLQRNVNNRTTSR